MKILVLLTDAFGGFGGISRYNRDFLTALSCCPDVDEIVVLPRVAQGAVGPIPNKITNRAWGVNSKSKYLMQLLNEVLRSSRPDLIICGHINLLPLARSAQQYLKVPLALLIYGIEAWEPTGRSLTDRCVKDVDNVISISRITQDRLCAWSGIKPGRSFLLPPAVDLSQFGMGNPDPALVTRYKTAGKTVILTFGRLAGEERYKGFDEVLEALPELRQRIPNLLYLIAGDGGDRQRLELKASNLRVRDSVVFCGRIHETEKADHYRLADAYVMPSRGEGFGIVYLEAMACGIPTIASTLDGGKDALRDGMLGTLVSPDDKSELQEAIVKALATPKQIPAGLDYFSFPEFTRRVHEIIRSLIKDKN